MQQRDQVYLELILEPIRACAQYKPKFGQGNKGDGLTLEQFQERYRSDPFYSWFGPYDPKIYAAHKAAGGMTSIYRQIGIGCERLFRAILRDSLNLSQEDVTWSYQLTLPTGKKRVLSLDGRILLDRIADDKKRERVREWMSKSAERLGVKHRISAKLEGTVFEIRQGYKSKDSKRQNADIANAAAAYSQAYLPCAVILSNQIDEDILDRYQRERWVVITGILGVNDPLVSTYDFMRDVVGYDLAGFFSRNSDVLHHELKAVLEALLKP